MVSRLSKSPMTGLFHAAKTPAFNGLQKRGLANVQGNTPRQMPTSKPRQTSVSRDAANFAIRVRLSHESLTLVADRVDRVGQCSWANLLAPNRMSAARPYSARKLIRTWLYSHGKADFATLQVPWWDIRSPLRIHHIGMW